MPRMTKKRLAFLHTVRNHLASSSALSRTSLAAMAGITVQHAGRLLNQWEREGVIEVAEIRKKQSGKGRPWKVYKRCVKR